MIKLRQAKIVYDNDDILIVQGNEDGKYRWSLWKEGKGPATSTLVAANNDVAGVYNAMVDRRDAPPIDHPG